MTFCSAYFTLVRFVGSLYAVTRQVSFGSERAVCSSRSSYILQPLAVASLTRRSSFGRKRPRLTAGHPIVHVPTPKICRYHWHFFRENVSTQSQGSGISEFVELPLRVRHAVGK